MRKLSAVSSILAMLSVLVLPGCGGVTLPPVPIPSIEPPPACAAGEMPVFDVFSGWRCAPRPVPTPTPSASPTPVATPTPQPSATPTPVPSVPPPNWPPASGQQPQRFPDVTDDQYVPHDGNGSDTKDIAAEALRHLLDMRGLRCEGDGCDVVPTTCEQFQEDLGAELRARGLSSSPVMDRLYLARPGQNDPWRAIWDCWQLAHGGWDGKVGCKPGMPHVDPSPSWCGAQTLRRNQSPGLISCPPPTDYSVGIGIRSLGGIVPDATPAARNREYCSAVWRCPGPNCHEGFQVGCELGPHGSEQRNTCELIYGPWIWTLDGEQLTPHEGPFAVWLPRGTVGLLRICSKIGSICAERVLTGLE